MIIVLVILLILLFGFIFYWFVGVLEWKMRYGKKVDNLLIANKNIPILSKKEIDIDIEKLEFYINKHFINKQFLIKNNILNCLQISFIDLREIKAWGLAKKVFNWLRFKNIYIICINSETYKKLDTKQLAGLIIHEYGHLFFEYVYEDFNSKHDKQEWSFFIIE